MAKPKPVVLSADASSVDVVLTWVDSGPTVSSYKIQRGGSNIATLDAAIRTYTDEDVTEESVHTYRVRSFGGGTDVISNPVTVQLEPVDAPLISPTISGSAGDTQNSLSWTAVPNATSYTLQRKTTGAYSTIATQAGRTYLDTGRTNGTTYTYHVRGTSQGGNKVGPWSNALALTPVASIPVAPVLTGTAGDGENALDWNAVAGAATYRVRRAVESGPTNLLQAGVVPTDYLDDTAVNDTEYHYSVRGETAGNVLGEISNIVDLTPAPTEPPETPGIVGYAGVAGVNGGAGGTVYTPNSWASFKTALNASGSRIVRPTGSADFNGNGETLTITNPNLTVDGTNWTGALRNYKIIVRASNTIWRQLALKTGEGGTPGDSADRRALTFNPQGGATIQGAVIDHCSLMWGPDVVLSFLNRCQDVTIQYCLVGPALYESNIASGPNGYGPNITTTTGPADFTRRVTFYRNLIAFNDKRNFRGHGVMGWDVVNNVMYNWGSKSGHGNPQGANIVNNVYKKGPKTTNSEGWDSEISGGDFNQLFADSLYINGNVGRTTAMAPFTLTYAFGGSRNPRPTPYDGGPTAPSHGPLVVAAANDALFDAVVAAAGRTHQDAVDTQIKAWAAAGTGPSGGNGWYNGASGPAPHPSW